MIKRLKNLVSYKNSHGSSPTLRLSDYRLPVLLHPLCPPAPPPPLLSSPPQTLASAS
ncbi:hypothetical protein SAY86_011414 [Trapa natans]|uniref:Uncharacterized protein n=1 Tax=Trapa natans TaxID=22666 RepID=A0AAN7LZ12_TRANT|nr:hypothetical protein SAY86_011414 [Trapa natans]